MIHTRIAATLAHRKNLRVAAGIGHGEKARLGVLQLEILIGELLAVDGLAAGALRQLASACAP